mgnify:FL=1
MQQHLVVVVRVLQYRKRRQEFREFLGQITFVFIFIMLQILGVYIIFADQL